MSRYKQGFFKPKNISKYKGDPTQIVYRSSWELSALMKLDSNPDVIQYSSEEIVIPYLSKIDNKIHRYFTDLWVKLKLPDGSIQEYIFEIKPSQQTIPPKKPKNLTKKFIKEVETYTKNRSKWDAAEEYCKKRGMKFQIITEKDLGVK